MSTNYDMNVPGMGKILSTDLAAHANRTREQNSPPKHSWRISPSSLADECVARLWMKYRWIRRKQTEGRMLRLFEDGQKAEFDFEAELKAMGFEVQSTDPERVARGVRNPQFKIEDYHGHLKGYLDGFLRHPHFTKGAWVLGEFKTFNAKNFKLWRDKGVKVSHPKYYGQACIYMRYYELPFAIVVGKNKDDSDLQFEVVLRDDGYVNDLLLRRADTLINSRARPARLAESPAHHKCKSCDFIGQCHYGEPPEINCRSCLHAHAVEGGQFGCDLYGSPIPQDVVPNACPQYQSIL